MSRVLGMLSFVNVIWAFSIIGLLISVGPCVAVIFKPVLEALMTVLVKVAEVVKDIVVWVVR